MKHRNDNLFIYMHIIGEDVILETKCERNRRAKMRRKGMV